MIKDLVKQTPLMNIYRTFRNRNEYLETMRWNEKYRKSIEVLKDLSILKAKLQDLNRNYNGRPAYIIRQDNTKVGICGYINCQ